MFFYYLLSLVFYAGEEFEKAKYLIKSKKPITGSELYDVFIKTDEDLSADETIGYDSGFNIDTFIRKVSETPTLAILELKGSQNLSDRLQGYFEAEVYGKENRVNVEYYCASPKEVIPKTNFQLIKNFIEVFRPAHKGVLTDDEVKEIEIALYVKERTIIDLRNLRDMAVMVLSKVDEDPVYMDMMSGITAVIDENIYALGGEV